MRTDDERPHNDPELSGAGTPRAEAAGPAGTGELLDAVCRGLAQLARSAPEPPRRIRLQDGQASIEIEWPDPLPGAAAPAPAVVADLAEVPEGPADDAHSYVRSPMVGTFYHASSPDAPPFVRIGDVVEPGQPVGVLEAMKMMNTVTAEVGGRVVELVVPNAQPVEFDQTLIALAPVPADQEA
ncbi:acetyl-CoA carboxylase biotin carboxyl carrier protein [Streptacidiphilus neutrinimicus]|uniref:acetyl-CoA carboxylase biotin carboxyl carrier protein n=1 Tax=Streptacidiphilus neutrinimicus TaxID=105420 RepID=UPI0006934133|nr:acetyl-CoA carboxylase biotin carboxyl carrier protein [Streptacidiphilus neutrinimicus]